MTKVGRLGETFSGLGDDRVGSVENRLDRTIIVLEDARKAMQQGDWAKFGTAMEGLEHQLAGPAPR